jgi:hypothetical protein
MAAVILDQSPRRLQFAPFLCREIENPKFRRSDPDTVATDKKNARAPEATTYEVLLITQRGVRWEDRLELVVLGGRVDIDPAGRSTGKKEESVFEPDAPKRDRNAEKATHQKRFRTNFSLKN